LLHQSQHPKASQSGHFQPTKATAHQTKESHLEPNLNGLGSFLRSTQLRHPKLEVIYLDSQTQEDYHLMVIQPRRSGQTELQKPNGHVPVKSECFCTRH
jgi:hypothetical protein